MPRRYSAETEKLRETMASLPPGLRAGLDAALRDAATELNRQDPDAAKANALLYPAADPRP